MIKNKFGLIFLICILLISFASADFIRSTIQNVPFASSQSVGNFDSSMCEAGQDFIIQIAPSGCTPAVVRDDLLEEQNVPVYCQLAATKINPLINVEAIDSISFSGEYPDEVAGVGFHPARAALGVEENLNSPVLNNIGYVVILLKEQNNASGLPEFVEGTLTAKVSYDIENVFGIGKVSFYLPELSNVEWENNFNQYSFWGEKAYVKAESINEDEATISLYDSNLRKISTGTLRKGESSGKIYLSGFDCLAGLELKLDDIKNPDRRVKLRIDDDVVEVLKEDKFLDNKCRVVNFEEGFGESVTIKCTVDEGNGNINLKVQPKIKLSFDGANEEGYEIGDWLYDTQNSKAVYLGAVGTYGDTKKAEDLYVYLVETVKKSQLDEEDIKDVNDVAKALKFDRPTGIGAIDAYINLAKAEFGVGRLAEKYITKGMEFGYLYSTYLSKDGKIKEPAQNMFGKSVKIDGFAISQNKELDSETQNYYNEAMDDYDKILESFSAEEYSDEVTYGKKVLEQKIILAGELEQKETLVNLCDEFKEKYSSIPGELKKYCENGYQLSNSNVASKVVSINGESRKITFEGIYSPSLEEYSVDVFVKGADTEHTQLVNLQKGDRVYLSNSEFISLKSLENDKAIFDVSGIEGWKENLVSSDAEIELKKFKIIGKNNYQVRVDDINLKKIAQVSVIPDIKHTGTEANFSFKIGIEKRAIQLSPEKTKSKINDLDKTIDEWSGISKNLGNVVKGFQTACLATGTLLTAKNFFVNTGGKSIARQNVMRGEGGWYEQCTDFVNAGEYSSIDQCLSDNGDEIEEDVNTFYDVIQKQNEDIKDLQDDSSKSGFLSNKVVDDEKFVKEYAQQVQEYLENNLDETINDPNNKAGSIDKEEVINILSQDNWNSGSYSIEQLKSIELYANVLESDPNNPIAKKGLYSVLAEVKGNSIEIQKSKSLAEELNSKGLQNIRIRPFANEKTKVEVYDGATVSGSFGGMALGTPVQAITYQGKDYVLELNDLGNGQYDIKNVYGTNGNKVSEDEKNKITRLYAFFQKYDRSSYENEFKSSFGESKPQIKYYETEPYKGLPAIVPFDLENGWYAATKQTLPVLGSIAAYDESGRVSSFWLCNVGSNGIEEFNSVGDDVCQMINLGTGQPYNQFAGLTESEATKIVDCAQDAILDASRGYGAGVKNVQINTNCGKSFSVEVGSPAVDISDMQCQDFMSPNDCKLLFNVCDPVICPSSRCDLGGAYPVQDVVQSGIIGSIALCLPNAKEGIVIPVCLSGINAGLESYLSVVTSYRDCLQESLDTGQQVGICDEIHSIYMCEFFWRQALPLAKIALPKLFETLLGQNTRGGGEYLGVQSAWTNAESSVNYLTQYYGKNAFDAFKARSSDEVGGEICKVFESGILPNGGDLISSLTEPDSPPQFYGRFEEIPFTTATVPPTSQYKVFYHIYAGKNSGAYYRVYLKGAAGTSFYQDVSSSRIVASGYIETGGYASETVDFTSPSGYQQMCIMVNNQEECGFAQVSTDFAVNYVTDKYLEEQTTQTNIKTETECISGTASFYNLLNPNVQEGVDEMINPEIYAHGIIRVCATDNPGQGTDAYAGGEGSRWMNVGYCGDEKIRCWIDRESVKNVIKNSEIEGDALDKVTEDTLVVLNNNENYFSEGDFDKKVDEIKKLIKDEEYNEAIEKVDENLDSVFWNKDKAQLIFLRGTSNEKLALDDYKETNQDEATLSDEQLLEQEKEAEIGTTSNDNKNNLVSDDSKQDSSINKILEENKLCNNACAVKYSDNPVGNCEEFGIGKSLCSNNGYILEGNYCEGDSMVCCCSATKIKEAENFEEVMVDEDYISPRFEVELWVTGVADVNYRYFNQKWYWSFGTEKWTSLNNFVDQGVNELPDQHKLIVEKLRGKGYLDGVHILLDSLPNPNGLFVPKLKLRQSIISKEKIFDNNYQFVFTVNDYIGQESSYFVYHSGRWYTTFNKLFFPSWIPVADVDLDEAQHLASWVIENKNYEKVIKYEETFNLLNSLKNKGFDSGMITITNTFYEVSAEGIIQDKEITLREEINGADFSEVQKQIILAGENCKSCNSWINKGCTKEVCESIGIQIGAGCFYKLKEDYYSTGESEYICVEVKWEKTNEPSKNYDLESALEKIEELSKWYENIHVPLDWNYEIKQFVWDLRLNDVLTDNQYKDLTRSNFFVPSKTLSDLRKILQVSGGAH